MTTSQRTTTLINLWAGPGSGKSTTATDANPGRTADVIRAAGWKP